MRDQPGQLIDVAVVERWIRLCANAVHEHREELTALDAAIGDADHGANLDRGFTAVVAVLDAAAVDGTAVHRTAFDSASALLKAVGMKLVSTVGGASGPLYGTFFLRMATSAGDVAVLAPAAFATALRAGVDGVVARGKPVAGDKTMYDALAPACDALDAALAAGSGLAEALRAASAAADAGRDATVPMLARKGRASYLGERSIGHQDPGATSSALFIACAASALG